MIASGNRARIVYSSAIESTHGTIPANVNVQQLRVISRDINLTKTTLQSQEVYPDGQVRDVRHGFNQVAGSFQYELSLAQQSAGTITHTGFDDMLADLMGSTWSATGAAGGSPGTLKNGTTLNTRSFERQFLDLGKYQAHGGVIPTDLSINFAPGSIIGGTVTLAGMQSPASMSGTSIQGSGTLTTATTAPPVDTFIGAITEGGTTLAVATQVTLNIKTGRQLAGVIGSKFSPDVFGGTFLLTGTLSAMFKDSSLADKFYNETPSTMVLTCNELNGSGRQMVFTLPNIKYTGNSIQPPPEGPVIQNAPFMALFDPTSGTTLQIDRYL